MFVIVGLNLPARNPMNKVIVEDDAWRKKQKKHKPDF